MVIIAILIGGNSLAGVPPPRGSLAFAKQHCFSSAVGTIHFPKRSPRHEPTFGIIVCTHVCRQTISHD